MLTKLAFLFIESLLLSCFFILSVWLINRAGQNYGLKMTLNMKFAWPILFGLLFIINAIMYWVINSDSVIIYTIAGSFLVISIVTSFVSALHSRIKRY